MAESDQEFLTSFDYLDWTPQVDTGAEFPVQTTFDSDKSLKSCLDQLASKAKGASVLPSSPDMPGFGILQSLLVPQSHDGEGAVARYKVAVSIDGSGVMALTVRINDFEGPSALRSRSQADNIATITAHLVKRVLGEDIGSYEVRQDCYRFSGDSESPEPSRRDKIEFRYELGPTDPVPIPLETPCTSDSSSPADYVMALLRSSNLLGLCIRKDFAEDISTSSVNALAALARRRVGLRDQLFRAIDTHRDIYRNSRPILRVSAHLAMSMSAVSGVFLGTAFSETVTQLSILDWVPSLRDAAFEWFPKSELGSYWLLLAFAIIGCFVTGLAALFGIWRQREMRPRSHKHAAAMVKTSRQERFLSNMGEFFAPPIRLLHRFGSRSDRPGRVTKTKLDQEVRPDIAIRVQYRRSVFFPLLFGCVCAGILAALLGVLAFGLAEPLYSERAELAPKSVYPAAVALGLVIMLGPFWGWLSTRMARTVASRAQRKMFAEMGQQEVQRSGFGTLSLFAILSLCIAILIGLMVPRSLASMFFMVTERAPLLDREETGLLALALFGIALIFYWLCSRFHERAELLQGLSTQGMGESDVATRKIDRRKLDDARVSLRVGFLLGPVAMLVVGFLLFATDVASEAIHIPTITANGKSGLNPAVYHHVLQEIGWALPVLAFGVFAQVWNRFGQTGALTLIHEVTLARLNQVKALLEADAELVDRIKVRLGDADGQDEEKATVPLPDLKREANLVEPKITLINALQESVRGGFLRRSALVAATVFALLQVDPLKKLEPATLQDQSAYETAQQRAKLLKWQIKWIDECEGADGDPAKCARPSGPLPPDLVQRLVEAIEKLEKHRPTVMVHRNREAVHDGALKKSETANHVIVRVDPDPAQVRVIAGTKEGVEVSSEPASNVDIDLFSGPSSVRLTGDEPKSSVQPQKLSVTVTPGPAIVRIVGEEEESGTKIDLSEISELKTPATGVELRIKGGPSMVRLSDGKPSSSETEASESPLPEGAKEIEVSVKPKPAPIRISGGGTASGAEVDLTALAQLKGELPGLGLRIDGTRSTVRLNDAEPSSGETEASKSPLPEGAKEVEISVKPKPAPIRISGGGAARGAEVDLSSVAQLKGELPGLGLHINGAPSTVRLSDAASSSDEAEAIESPLPEGAKRVKVSVKPDPAIVYLAEADRPEDKDRIKIENAPSEPARNITLLIDAPATAVVVGYGDEAASPVSAKVAVSTDPALINLSGIVPAGVTPDPPSAAESVSIEVVPMQLDLNSEEEVVSLRQSTASAATLTVEAETRRGPGFRQLVQCDEPERLIGSFYFKRGRESLSDGLICMALERKNIPSSLLQALQGQTIFHPEGHNGPDAAERTERWRYPRACGHANEHSAAKRTFEDFQGDLALGLIEASLPGNSYLVALGYADSTGRRRYNFEISDKRAANVREAIRNLFTKVKGKGLNVIGGEDHWKIGGLNIRGNRAHYSGPPPEVVSIGRGEASSFGWAIGRGRGTRPNDAEFRRVELRVCDETEAQDMLNQAARTSR